MNAYMNKFSKNYVITIPDTFAGKRIDLVLSTIVSEFSRNKIINLIKNGNILVNEKKTLPKQIVYGGEQVVIDYEPSIIDFIPQEISLNIIYEDEDIIVINKPSGLVVHPGNGNLNKTLLNALLFYCPKLSAVPRAGIVHRLDKDTSGNLIIAKNLISQLSLIKQLQLRTVKRLYYALVEGRLFSNGSINKNIGRCPHNRIKMTIVDNGGKEAITNYKTIKIIKDFSLVECSLETGRTHQIRVHFKYLNHPLVGDKTYGSNRNYSSNINEAIKKLNRQALHAYSLTIIHPTSNKQMVFHSELADDFKCLISTLEDIDILSN